MKLLPTLRKIRACEGEVASQIVFEAFIAEQLSAITAERDALKARIEEAEKQEPIAWKHVTSGGYGGEYMREQILQFNPEELQKFAKDLDLKDFVIHSSTPLYEKPQ